MITYIGSLLVRWEREARMQASTQEEKLLNDILTDDYERWVNSTSRSWQSPQMGALLSAQSPQTGALLSALGESLSSLTSRLKLKHKVAQHSPQNDQYAHAEGDQCNPHAPAQYSSDCESELLKG